MHHFSIYLLGPRRMELIGFIEARTEALAIAAAAQKFAFLGEWKLRRLCARPQH